MYTHSTDHDDQVITHYSEEDFSSTLNLLKIFLINHGKQIELKQNEQILANHQKIYLMFVICLNEL